MLETATKDKDSGIIQINESLETRNGEASLLFFDDLVQSIKEVEGWMYEDKGDNIGKPSKKRYHSGEYARPYSR